MPTAWLVAAPPMAPEMWAQVARRLEGHFHPELVDLFEEGGVDGRVEALAERMIDRMGSTADGVLIAHGLAVPVAMAVGARRPTLPLVLANGPIGAMHPLVAAIGGLARTGPLATAVLAPRLSVPLLASSLGLRRAVRNPYVMDRDNVVAICAPSLRSKDRRKAASALLGSLPAFLRSTPQIHSPTLLVWGDEDRLHPPAMVDEARARILHLEHHRVPGGRFLHPVEQPWDMADSIVEWWKRPDRDMNVAKEPERGTITR